MRILVTGAAGFLGRAVIASGAEAGHTMIAASRTGEEIEGADRSVATGDMAAGDFVPDLARVDAVINCAARVHVTKAEAPDEAARAYHAANVAMPVALAKRAREAGVRSFVQVSSVAAIASTTPDGSIIDDATPPSPTSAYGKSKLEADRALADLATDEFTVVSLRPPAIFGPGVGAWFAMLMRAARLGMPLPVGAIRNTRSFAFVGNIAEASLAAVNLVQSGAFIVTDSQPLSTADLYRKLLEGFGYGDRAWSWPSAITRIPAQIALGDRASSLLGTAAFDGSRFVAETGWQPRWTMDEALRLTLEPE